MITLVGGLNGLFIKALYLAGETGEAYRRGFHILSWRPPRLPHRPRLGTNRNANQRRCCIWFAGYERRKSAGPVCGYGETIWPWPTNCHRLGAIVFLYFFRNLRPCRFSHRCLSWETVYGFHELRPVSHRELNNQNAKLEKHGSIYNSLQTTFILAVEICAPWRESDMLAFE